MKGALGPYPLQWLVSMRSCSAHARRAFAMSARRLAVQNFLMPAMSPTMTEGNIANWRIEEGESFVAGDVLLEIETDKAQMDVEAQYEGKLAKIVHPAGSKGVKVGTQIAMTADPDEDLGTLDLSTASSTEPAFPSKELGGTVSDNSAWEPQAQISQISTASGVFGVETASSQKPASIEEIQTTRFPLFPSVIQVLHERGISDSEAVQIPASGPSGRLLKGDVLAYIGAIDTLYVQEQSKRIEQLSHMNLSNIQIATPPQVNLSPPQMQPEVLDEPMNVTSEVALPISLAAVHEVRQRVSKVLGIDISIETFITRATQLCNDDLPRSATQPQTADELFSAVLGLDHITTAQSRSLLIPHIQAFDDTPPTKFTLQPEKLDIIDELTSIGARPARRLVSLAPERSTNPNMSLFSVSVPIGDEARGRVFLERLKTVLQVEPGRLVL